MTGANVSAVKSVGLFRFKLKRRCHGRGSWKTPFHSHMQMRDVSASLINSSSQNRLLGCDAHSCWHFWPQLLGHNSEGCFCFSVQPSYLLRLVLSGSQPYLHKRIPSEVFKKLIVSCSGSSRDSDSIALGSLSCYFG